MALGAYSAAPSLCFWTAHLYVIRQSVRSHGYDNFSFLESLDNLYAAVFLNAGLHFALMRMAVGTHNHYATAFLWIDEQGAFRNNDGVRGGLGHHGEVHAGTCPELSLGVFRLGPYFNGGAVGIESRADDGHLSRNFFLAVQRRNFGGIARFQVSA